MFEDDYIMRMIHEMVRVILKFLFNVDGESVEDIKIEDENVEVKYNWLMDLVHKGKINEAENMLYENLDITNKYELQAALMFYQYLNTYSADYLEENNFSQEEIKTGIKTVLKLFGQDGLTEMLNH